MPSRPYQRQAMSPRKCAKDISVGFGHMTYLVFSEDAFDQRKIAFRPGLRLLSVPADLTATRDGEQLELDAAQTARS